MRLESMPLLSLPHVEYVDIAFLAAANQQLMLRRQDQRTGSLLVTHETWRNAIELWLQREISKDFLLSIKVQVVILCVIIICTLYERFVLWK